MDGEGGDAGCQSRAKAGNMRYITQLNVVNPQKFRSVASHVVTHKNQA